MLTDHPTPAAPAASATSRTSRSRVLPLAGLTLAATLVLASCSGDAEEPIDDGGTGATEAAPTEESTAPSEEPPSADDTESSPDNTEGSEGSDSDDEYVPASADEPAQNVPKPDLPEVAAEKTEDGVEAAVEYFWEADWYLASTGEPEPFEAIFRESCNFCTNDVSYFGDVYASGAWYDNEPDEVSDLSVDLTSETEATAHMAMHQSPNAMYRPNGEKAGSQPAIHDVMWTLELSHQGGRWKVESATSVEGSGSEGEAYVD
ncbi:DUF6318 family protein [Nesterenkonia halobia]|uniref:DUF6318 family protein n=1 Tax=Nesterenkonia halobia TaxID=37922 RepID=UPI0031DE119D